MTKRTYQEISNKKGSMAKKNSEKEEISMELAELGNLQPKQEPMSPNPREKSEREKSH